MPTKRARNSLEADYGLAIDTLYRDILDMEWVEMEHTVGYRLDGLPAWVPYV